MRSIMSGRMRLAAAMATVLLSLGLVGAVVFQGMPQEEEFPHAEHAGLFPLCTGCHEGVPSGDVSTYYPAPDACSGCHDGVGQERVGWSGPEARETNVSFEHPEHTRELAAAGEEAQDCQACHSEPGERMSVGEEVQLETCWSCHQATEHHVDAECATCHMPLAETGFSGEAIEGLPTPEDHRTDGFLIEEHGASAEASTQRCATCHTADRCLTCHVDAGRDEIQELALAPEGMELPPTTAHYPEPGSHLDEDWTAGHGGQASRSACATCHTSDDCASCHLASAPEVVETLPGRAEALAPGVGVEPHAPESHDSYFFLDVHGNLAAGDGGSCATCHQETFCNECHDGPPDGGYHPPSFVSRHSAAAFGRDAECANCHSTEVFCRSCHVEVGVTGSGRLGPGYHDGQSLWLLRHGQAARQNLESCASCHKQNDCTQCHGVLGSFQVNPHSRDFDAERAWARSPRTCVACHIRNPLNGSEP